MSKQLSYWFFPPFQPSKMLYYTREFCGLNQKEMAALLMNTQGWLSKMEQGIGEVKFNLDQLQSLKANLDISIDHFVCGQIPFRKLLRNFKNSSFLPARYAFSANAPMRTAYPILMSFVDQVGEQKTINLLKNFKLEEFHFADPTLLINSNLIWDLFELGIREKIISEKQNSIEKLVQHALDPRVFGDMFKNASVGDEDVHSDFIEFLRIVYMQIGLDDIIEFNPKERVARMKLPLDSRRDIPSGMTSVFALYLSRLYSNLNRNIELKHQIYFKEILEYEFA